MTVQVFLHGADRRDDRNVAEGEDGEGQHPSGYEEAENEDAVDRVL